MTNMKELQHLREEGDKEFDKQVKESFATGGFLTRDFDSDWGLDLFLIKDFIQSQREKAFKLGQISGVELAYQRIPDFYEECPTYGLSGDKDSGHTEGYGLALRESLTNLTTLAEELGK